MEIDTRAIAASPLATVERILVATGEEASAVGLERLRMGSVAKRAGISRASLYRAFASKDDLIHAWTTHEFDAIFEAVDLATAAAAGGDAEERFAAGFAAALSELRAHPVFRSLVLINSTQLMRSTLESASGLDHARSLLAERLAGAVGPGLERTEAELAIDSEILVRLVLSLVVAPESTIRIESEADAREFARRHLSGIALGERADLRSGAS